MPDEPTYLSLFAGIQPEDSILPLNGLGSDVSDKSRSTNPVPASSSDTGPTSADGATLLPTPNGGNFNDGESTETWRARKERNLAKGINGNGMGTPLAMEVKLLAESTSSSEDSPASQSAKPDAAAPKPTSGGSGLSSSELSSRHSRGSSSSRTFVAYCQPPPTPPFLLTDAYVAGLLDGEGCIGIQERKKTFAARVDFGMALKALPMLEQMHAQFGGSLRMFRAATERWDEAWTWSLTKREEVKAFLEAVMPFVVVKKEQTAMALRLITMIEDLPKHKNGSASWTQQARKDGASIKALMHQLNQKGPSVTPQAGWFARYVGGQLLTDQRSLLDPTGWEKFSGTWPASGLMRDGAVYELPMSELPIDESGSSSLLPTPEAWLGRRPGSASYDPTREASRRHEGKRGQRSRTLLPTPRTSDTNGTGTHGTGGKDLRTSVGELTNQPSSDGSK